MEQLRTFEGEAAVQLNGLPAHTSTESRKITKDTKELIFPIKSTKDARARTSKTLFTAINIPWTGHVLRQSAGSGGHAHRPSAVSVIYSDDSGDNWKRGELVAAAPSTKALRATGIPEIRNPGETVAVQLQDGRILLNLRNESTRRRRAISTSADGISGWSRYHFDDALIEPICMGSIVRLSERPRHRKNRILFANPHNPASRARQNVSVKLSYDEAKTWPVMKAIEAGPSAYTDLAVGPDGTIYCFYERGKTDRLTKSLCLATFSLEWLSGGADRLISPSK